MAGKVAGVCTKLGLPSRPFGIHYVFLGNTNKTFCKNFSNYAASKSGCIDLKSRNIGLFSETKNTFSPQLSHQISKAKASEKKVRQSFGKERIQRWKPFKEIWLKFLASTMYF